MFIVNNYKTYSNNQLPLIKHMNYNLIFCELGFQAPFPIYNLRFQLLLWKWPFLVIFKFWRFCMKMNNNYWIFFRANFFNC